MTLKIGDFKIYDSLLNENSILMNNIKELVIDSYSYPEVIETDENDKNDNYIFVIPPRLKKLTIKSIYQKINIIHIPETVEYIEIGSMDPLFAPIFPYFPRNLKHLHIGYLYNKKIPTFPDSLCTLDIIEYRHILTSFPKNITYLSLNTAYVDKTIKLPDSIEYLYLAVYMEGGMINKLPRNLKFLHLKIDTFFGCVFPKIPKHINTLKILTHTDIIFKKYPRSLRKLLFVHDYSRYMAVELPHFPKNLRHIHIPPYYNKKLQSLPKHLNTFAIGIHYNVMQLKLPKSVKKLIIYNYHINNEYVYKISIGEMKKLHQQIKQIFTNNISHIEKIVYKYDSSMYYQNLYNYDNLKTIMWNNKPGNIFIYKCKKNKPLIYSIKRNLTAYIKYMMYNKVFIPYEIYHYIYCNFNFSLV